MEIVHWLALTIAANILFAAGLAGLGFLCREWIKRWFGNIFARELEKYKSDLSFNNSIKLEEMKVRLANEMRLKEKAETIINKLYADMMVFAKCIAFLETDSKTDVIMTDEYLESVKTLWNQTEDAHSYLVANGMSLPDEILQKTASVLVALVSNLKMYHLNIVRHRERSDMDGVLRHIANINASYANSRHEIYRLYTAFARGSGFAIIQEDFKV